MILWCLVVFQLQLFSTWGDLYYIGLNGIEFYDEAKEKIPLTRDSKQCTTKETVNMTILELLFLNML